MWLLNQNCSPSSRKLFVLPNSQCDCLAAVLCWAKEHIHWNYIKEKGLKRDFVRCSKVHVSSVSQNHVNPAVDFTQIPPGMLALDNMLYFARHHQDAYIRVSMNVHFHIQLGPHTETLTHTHSLPSNIRGVMFLIVTFASYQNRLPLQLIHWFVVFWLAPKFPFC